MTYAHPYKQRRGVTLLVVLGLMIMFAMLVVTFMVVTTQARRTAEIMAGSVLNDDVVSDAADIKKDLDKASLMLLVGGFSNGNAIGPHGILENLYGHPNYVNSSGGDEINYEGTATARYQNGRIEITGFSTFDGPLDLVGSVLTVTEPGSGTNAALLEKKSTTILDVIYTGGGSTAIDFIVVAPFANVALTDTNQATALNGCTVIVNTPAFSGTGPGFDNTVGASAAALTGNDSDGSASIVYALRPNALAPNDDGTQKYKEYLTNTLVLMNPDYTAPDYLNMFLGWYDVNGTSTPTIDKVIPSFHRPQLVTYHNPGNTDYNTIRKIVMRPMPFDHPNFKGSNPAANSSNLIGTSAFLQAGPWDVDNDNDGIADSIWLDVGLGTVTDSTTNKTYKKLAAFLVLDMDGRLNVNVHGNLLMGSSPSSTGTAQKYGGIGTTIQGGGSGTAEVRIDEGGTKLDNGKLQTLLKGASSDLGRYGDTTGTAQPGNPTNSTDASIYSNTAGFDPDTIIGGQMGVNPFAYAHMSVSGAVGGLPPDLWGYFPIAFDPLGNRYFDTATWPFGSNLYAFNPYLMNPYGGGSDDQAFTADELQFLLRSPGDIDFMNLPARIRALLNDNATDEKKWSEYRLTLTTQSSDIPASSRYGGVRVTPPSSGTPFIARSILEMAYNYAGTNAADFINLLPEEIRRGEKINLNRLTLNQNWTNYTPGANYETMLKEKAKFAQGIYLLMVTLCWEQIHTANYTEGPWQSKADVLTRLAQWSVNLVDFIDADSVMTPFIFSIDDPFNQLVDYDSTTPGDPAYDFFTNGTAPSGNYRHVWGFEKPEVALTETFATHNRRVADTSRESLVPNICPDCSKDLALCSPTCPANPPANHDTDFDQVLIPQGSLYVELYRQGNPGRKSLPGLDVDATTGDLNLAQMSQGGTPVPVWRLAISEASGSTFGTWNQMPSTGQPQDALDQSMTDPAFEFPHDISNASTAPNMTGERYIWFTANANVPAAFNGISYANVGGKNGTGDLGPNVKLASNQYLVIGPRLHTSIESKPVTAAGGPYGVPDAGADTEIDLGTTGNLPANCQVMIAAAPGTAGIDPELGVAGMHGIGVSASEPLPNAYYSGSVKKQSGNSEYEFVDAAETPIALPSPIDVSDLFGYGTIPCYKTILLQRLADPFRNYDAVTNPYITVDWNMIDLHVFNSESNEDPAEAALTRLNEPNIAGTSSTLILTSRQWGVTGIPSGDGPSYPNLWSRIIKDVVASHGLAGLDGTPIVGGGKLKFDGLSLGEMNPFVLKSETAKTNTDSDFPTYGDVPNQAFLHLPWNDAPLANSFELMMVPACTAGRFGLEFIDMEIDPIMSSYQSLGSGAGARFRNPSMTATLQVGPYFNFYHDSTGGSSLDLARFLEFVRVPSKFSGTIRGWTNETSPRPIYSMREPGKINLNTATEAAWKALGAGRSGWPAYSGSNSLRDVRGDESPANTDPSEFSKPFRSPNAMNLVPTGTPRSPLDATLLRPTTGGTTPLVDPPPASGDGTNPYTTMESVMRLGDVTTTRSNVFAVWVTIGYFEVNKFDKNDLGNGSNNDLWHVHSTVKNHFPDQTGSTDDKNYFDAVYPDGYVLGEEKGVDDGDVKRHRAFYLIDRSIPVGFRRGDEKLNSKDVIVFERILE